MPATTVGWEAGDKSWQPVRNVVPPIFPRALSSAVLSWPKAAWLPKSSTHEMPRHNVNRLFALLFGSYTLEGVGYIIAGTFLVAAVAQHSPGWLGNGAWLVVGLAAIPSAALWGA